MQKEPIVEKKQKAKVTQSVKLSDASVEKIGEAVGNELARIEVPAAQVEVSVETSTPIKRFYIFKCFYSTSYYK